MGMAFFSKPYNFKLLVYFTILGLILIDCKLVFSFSNSPRSLPESLQSNVFQDDALPFKAGDGLFVSTFPDTNILNKIYTIDEKGYVEFPITGKLHIVKMTKKDLILFIKKNFQDFLRYPYVQVKPLIRVSILGGVAQPGLYYVDQNLSLWELIRQTGGFVLEDGIRELKWERNDEIVSDNLIRFYENGASLRTLGVKSGDQFWTPSPTTKTLWNKFNENILPIVSVVTTVMVVFLTYQSTVAINSK